MNSTFQNNPLVDNGIITVPAANDPAWLPGRRNWIPPYAIIFQILTTFLLALRLGSRLNKGGGRLGIDDAFISLAWVLGFTITILVIYGTKTLGWDRHMLRVPPNDRARGAHFVLIAEHLFIYSLLCTKLSILMFYRRLVAGTYSKSMKWILWFGMAFAVVTSVIPSSLLLSSCRPFEANWMQWDLTYVHTNAYKFQCRSTKTTVIIAQWTGALSVMTDFYSVLLPSIHLLRMSLNKRQRCGLLLLFGVGYIVVIVGGIRTYHLSEATKLRVDKTWMVFNVWVASIAEGNLAIMCACAPSLKGIFGKYFHNLTSKGNSKESDQKTSNYIGSENMGLYFDPQTSAKNKITGDVYRSDSVSSQTTKIPAGEKRVTDIYDSKELTSIKVHEYDLDNISDFVDGCDHQPVTRLDSRFYLSATPMATDRTYALPYSKNTLLTKT